MLGDSTQLHQVLLNRCVNARDAMSDGGTLNISIDTVVLSEQAAAHEIDAKAGSYVVLRVDDSGSGMPPDVVDRIVDPCFTTKPLGKGTGLGLSTSLAIVRSHCAFMQVHGIPHLGSTFSVMLPAHVGAVRDVEESALARPRRGKQELILVVDDEPQVRDITGRTREAFGYRVVLASNGAEAVTWFKEHSADIALVLADMMIPAMDGLALVRAPRELSTRVPIVAVSGLADSDALRTVHSGSVSRLLAKPFTADVLLATIADVLDA